MLNLPLIGIWIRLLSVPYRVLFPAIVAFACIGTFAINLNVFDVVAVVFFGVLGYVLIKLGCEPAPLLLGFVLGPLLENHMRRALIISHGDLSTFVTRPISLAFLIIAAVALVIAASPWIRRKREVVFREEPA
jgi:TctA family transporter